MQKILYMWKPRHPSKKILKILITWWIFFSEFYSFPQQLYYRRRVNEYLQKHIFTEEMLPLQGERNTSTRNTKVQSLHLQLLERKRYTFRRKKQILEVMYYGKTLAHPTKTLKILKKRKSQSRKIAQIVQARRIQDHVKALCENS